MPDDFAPTLDRPPVRRAVQVIAAATLGGWLLVDVLGPGVFAGERFAPPGRFLVQPGWESGGVGGALPDTVLTRGSRSIPARDLRPAVLMLAKPGCNCVRAMRHVVAQSDGSGVRVYVIGVSGREVHRIAAEARGDVVALVDETAAVYGHYASGSDATLLLVRRDGIVVGIIDQVDRDLPLRSQLPALLDSP
ncbi:MAG: hypothetical protein ABIM89_07390 [Mycobacteriales bacterium]